MATGKPFIQHMVTKDASLAWTRALFWNMGVSKVCSWTGGSRAWLSCEARAEVGSVQVLRQAEEWRPIWLAVRARCRRGRGSLARGDPTW